MCDAQICEHRLSFFALLPSCLRSMYFLDEVERFPTDMSEYLPVPSHSSNGGPRSSQTSYSSRRRLKGKRLLPLKNSPSTHCSESDLSQKSSSGSEPSTKSTGNSQRPVRTKLPSWHADKSNHVSHATSATVHAESLSSSSKQSSRSDGKGTSFLDEFSVTATSNGPE